MVSRRAVLAGGGAALALPLAGCGRDDAAWERAAAESWAPLAAEPVMQDLIRFASLAANSHNAQPWRFAIAGDTVAIMPDAARRTPVVDPDDHHLYASLGCAAENLVIAAGAAGRHGEVSFGPAGAGGLLVDLVAGPTSATPLLAAIPERQCTRSSYDGRAVANGDLALLEQASRVDGVDVIVLTDRPRIEQLLEFVIEGNTEQIGDPAYVDELRDWIRFDAGHAAATRDGLHTAVSGNPSLPAWMGRAIFPWVFSVGSENDRYSEQLRSSSGVAIFVARRQDPEGWVAVGRAYQRFALQATLLGIRNSFVNQPVEVTAMRAAFASWLGIPDRRPDLVVRFGYAPPMPRSLRRRVTDIIV